MFKHIEGLKPEKIYEAIRLGVSDAIWKIANNATDAPCGDFSHHIKEGVREAMEKVGSREVMLDGASAMRQAGIPAEHYLVEAHKILTDKFTDCPSVSDAIELAKIMATDFNTTMMVMKMREIRDAINDLTEEVLGK